jgi:HSP20 family protein
MGKEDYFYIRLQMKGVTAMTKELTQWRPFREYTPVRELERFGREIDRFWDSFFERRPARIETGEEWLPALELAETENDYVVKAEVPGMDPKDVDISLSDGLLTIKGEKKQEREEKEADYHLIERSYGAFTRSIQIPRPVQGEKITASHKHGVLKIVLPKSEEAKKKEIKIKVA